MPSRKVKKHERRRCPLACCNCKRRKERCDGRQPCSRCICRGVHLSCTFQRPVRSSASTNPLLMVSPGSAFPAPSIQLPPVQPDCGHLPLPTSSVDVDGHSLATASVNATHHQPSQVFSAHRSAPVPRLSRLIHARTGNLVFIGDSANLCFLQIIRRLIHQSLGPCTFTEDPLRHMLVEADTVYPSQQFQY